MSEVMQGKAGHRTKERSNIQRTSMAGLFRETGNPPIRNGSGFQRRCGGGKVRPNGAASWRPQVPNRKRRFGWEQAIARQSRGGRRSACLNHG